MSITSAEGERFGAGVDGAVSATVADATTDMMEGLGDVVRCSAVGGAVSAAANFKRTIQPAICCPRQREQWSASGVRERVGVLCALDSCPATHPECSTVRGLTSRCRRGGRSGPEKEETKKKKGGKIGCEKIHASRIENTNLIAY